MSDIDTDTDLNDEQKEILKVIGSKDGISIDDISKQTGYINKDIALNIYRLTQLVKVYRQGALYYKVDMEGGTKPKPVATTPAPVAKHPIYNATSVANNTVLKKDATKPSKVVNVPLNAPHARNMGNYRRGSKLAPILMFLYKSRDINRYWTFDEMRSHLRGTTMAQIKLIVEDLVKDGGCTHVNNGYKWSNKLTYPFPELKKSDDHYLTLDVYEMFKNIGTVKSSSAVSLVVATSNNLAPLAETPASNETTATLPANAKLPSEPITLGVEGKVSVPIVMEDLSLEDQEMIVILDARIARLASSLKFYTDFKQQLLNRHHP